MAHIVSIETHKKLTALDPKGRASGIYFTANSKRPYSTKIWYNGVHIGTVGGFETKEKCLHFLNMHNHCILN